MISCSRYEALNGELTFSFSTTLDRASNVNINNIVEYDGFLFLITRVEKSISSGLKVASFECEHISYLLNDEEYNLDSFSYTGNPDDGLAQLLDGTPFRVNQGDFTENISLEITNTVSRREAVMELIALTGGEIEYDGDAIGIRQHRGSTIRRELLEDGNVTDISVTHDLRADIYANYSISFYKIANYAVGDEVHILFPPLGINVNTRIIAIEYDPFTKYSINIEVGSYKPTINTSLTEIEDSVVEVEKSVSQLEEQQAVIEETIANPAFVANNLYSGMGDVAELIVDWLSTAQRIKRYLTSDTSDMNYIDIHDQHIKLMTGATTGANEQLKSRSHQNLYWSQDISSASIVGGYPYINGVRVNITTTNTGFPVTVYTYTENPKMQIGFEMDYLQEEYLPKLIMGLGSGIGDREKFIIQKNVNGFELCYTDNTGAVHKLECNNTGHWYIDGLGFALVEDYPATQEPNVVYLKYNLI